MSKQGEKGFIRIGYGNIANAGRCVAIVQADSSPARRMIQEARERQLLIDASSGRRTRSILVMDSEHLLLSALEPELLSAQLGVALAAQDGEAEDEGAQDTEREEDFA